jgi:mannose-6-phosphate isomerase-like protein (cupin superfamily)
VSDADDTLPPVLISCVESVAPQWQVHNVEPGSTVELPFSFESMANQFVVNVADVPDKGPVARGRRLPPFQIKILADPVNMRTRHLAATQLTVSPANRVAMHRHPDSGKVLYILEGAARLLGPRGSKPVKLIPGQAAYIPPGYPHVIENMGRQIPVSMLQIFSPPGPELVYRDPRNPEGRKAFEVIRGQATAKDGAELELGSAREAESSVEDIFAADGHRPGLRTLQLPEGGSVPAVAFSGPEAATFGFVVEGTGTLKVGKETYELGVQHAFHVPEKQPFSLTFKKGEPAKVILVRAGSEKVADPGQAAAASKTKTP